MGIRFFKIIGVFSYIAAALSLFAAIGLAVLGGMQYVGNVVETAHPPKLSLEEYLQEKQSKQQDKPRVDSEAPDEKDNVRKAEGKVGQDKLDPLYDRIVAALDKFAAQTGQKSMNREGLGEYLIANTEELDFEQYLIFLESFAQEAEALLPRPQKIVALSEDSARYVKPDEFVAWFTSKYMKQFGEKQRWIQGEKLKQAADRVQALTKLTAAGSAFLVFVFFTMILLLVQIEANTRRTQ